MSRAAALLVVTCLGAAAVASAQPAGESGAAGRELEAARVLVESGRTGDGLEALDRLLERRPRFAAAYLLRSTARFVEGDRDGGRRDLDRALELDPSLRQAWLNRAALDLSEGAHDRALEALERARRLAPEAEDNHLNLGAVRLLRGEVELAERHFAAYLELSGGAARAHYLVASNYAMAGGREAALAHLARAIAGDEKTRLAARTDPNFFALEGDAELSRLLGTDGYRPPPGAHGASRDFDAAYDAGRGPLLVAVMNALQLAGRPVDARVEVTPAWALVWSDFRVKLEPLSPERGRVSLSAAPEAFSPEAWAAATEAFYRDVALQLVKLKAF